MFFKYNIQNNIWKDVVFLCSYLNKKAAHCAASNILSALYLDTTW